MGKARAKGAPWIGPSEGGAVELRIRAHPGARTSAVKAVDPWRGMLVVDVAAPAQDGRANDELVRVLSSRLGVPRSAVVVVQGARSHEKRVRVVGLDLEAAKARLGGLQ